MASNGSAPVCPVSRSQAVPGQPGRIIPFSPLVVDLPTAIQALNRMNNILLQIAGPGPVVNNIFPPLPFGFGPLSGNNGPNQDGGGRQKIRWRESQRFTSEVEVADPDDETGENIVRFKRIDGVLFVGTKSGLMLFFNV